MLEAIVAFFTANGLVALIAVGILAFELLAFIAIGRSNRAWRLMIPNALSGLSMLAALWVAMTDRPPALILLFLTLGFVAHLVDLKQRLFRKTASPDEPN
jgi:hypothetical protein